MAGWYVDSWCVLDGLAFASLREPRAFDDDALAPAETTVVIGPPEWRAVSIARVTTAVCAARGRFQESVFDDDGYEIEFDSLEDIREVVKRAYLAGGLGLDGSWSAEPVRPRLPRIVPPRSWQPLQEALEQERTDARVKLEAGIVHIIDDGEGTVALSMLAEVLTKSTDWDWAAIDEVTERQTDLLSWLHIGVLLEKPKHALAREKLKKVWDETAYHGLPVASLGLPPLHHRIRLLFRLPSLGEYPEFPAPKTLADQLLLACASRHCWQSIAS